MALNTSTVAQRQACRDAAVKTAIDFQQYVQNASHMSDEEVALYQARATDLIEKLVAAGVPTS